jgi:hypothetical protein
MHFTSIPSPGKFVPSFYLLLGGLARRNEIKPRLAGALLRCLIRPSLVVILEQEKAGAHLAVAFGMVLYIGR